MSEDKQATDSAKPSQVEAKASDGDKQSPIIRGETEAVVGSGAPSKDPQEPGNA